MSLQNTIWNYVAKLKIPEEQNHVYNIYNNSYYFGDLLENTLLLLGVHRDKYEYNENSHNNNKYDYVAFGFNY